VDSDERYDTMYYIYVRPKLTNSQLNLPHGNHPLFVTINAGYRLTPR